MLDLVSHISKPFQAFTIYNLFYWFCLRYECLKLWLFPVVTVMNCTVWKHENSKSFPSRTLISLSFNSNFVILWKNVGIQITWTFLMFLLWLSIVFASELRQNKPRKLFNTSVLMEVVMVHLEQLQPKNSMQMHVNEPWVSLQSQFLSTSIKDTGILTQSIYWSQPPFTGF